MKKLRDKLFISLTLPLLWMTVLIIDLVSFSTGRPQHITSRLFEDFVFLTSFLFFQVHSPVGASHEFRRLFLPFLFQFVFWWFVGFLILWLVAGNKTKAEVPESDRRDESRENK